jgi:hypothetical protein
MRKAKLLQLALFPLRLVPWEGEKPEPVKPRYSYETVEWLHVGPPQVVYEITDEQTGAIAYVTDEAVAKRFVASLLDKGEIS